MAYRKLGVRSDHRQAMFRSLMNALIDHERIETTEARAKEARRIAEKLLTLTKDANIHARRQAFALLRNEDSVKKLFNEIGPRYATREGGYTRIIKIGPRRGDAAPMAILELVK